MTTQFRQLNDGWNADPNAPSTSVTVGDGELILSFLANAYQFPRFAENQRLRLRFKNVRRFRLGRTNDEGWYRGQCRFSQEAPAWGEFYEISGNLKLNQSPDEWHVLDPTLPPGRHFLFYLRDETFECEADDWILEE